MNTFQLTCSLAVAETLSFSKAAKQPNVTQPAVMHQIRTLEEELRTKLFRRTSKMVQLTQGWSMFLTDAKSIPNIADTAKNGLRTRWLANVRLSPLVATAITSCIC